MSDRYQIEIGLYGYWVKDTAKGRSRFIEADPATLANLDTIFRDRERGRPPKVYFRDAEGKIGIPPEPDMIPKDCQRFECSSLAEEDALAKEMSAEMYSKWQDHGAMTEIFDGMFDDPRKSLVDALASGPRGRKEAEAIRIMLSDLDQEAAQRQKITSNVFFHNREYDR